MERIRGRGGLIVRLVISFGILAYLAFKINWPDLLHTLSKANPIWCFLAWLGFGPMLAITAWRWKILLKAQEISLPYWEALRLCLVSHFFNAFLLGTTGGDVIKIFYAAKAAPSKKTAAGLSVIVDRLLGLAVLVLLTTVTSVWQYEFFSQSKETFAAICSVFLIAGAGVAVAIGCFFLDPIRTILTRRSWWKKIPGHSMIETLLTAFHLYVRAWNANTQAVILSIFNHSFNVIIGICVAYALHMTIPLWPFIASLMVINLLVAIPISISGLGVREGLSVVFFSLLGVKTELAVSFSLSMFGILLLWSLVGGLFYLPYQQKAAQLK